MIDSYSCTLITKNEEICLKNNNIYNFPACLLLAIIRHNRSLPQASTAVCSGAPQIYWTTITLIIFPPLFRGRCL